MRKIIQKRTDLSIVYTILEASVPRCIGTGCRTTVSCVVLFLFVAPCVWTQAIRFVRKHSTSWTISLVYISTLRKLLFRWKHMIEVKWHNAILLYLNLPLRYRVNIDWVCLPWWAIQSHISLLLLGASKVWIGIPFIHE